MEEYFEIGMIVNSHGIKGEIKAIPLTDDPKRFDKLKWVYIDFDSEIVKYNIETVKYHKNHVLIKFNGINDRDATEKLKGHFIKIDRKNAVKLPEYTYFICDIIGCIVLDENGNKLGRIKDVLKTRSNDVYTIENDDKKEILIPALKDVIKDVSIENKIIIVSLPKGLMNNEI